MIGKHGYGLGGGGVHGPLDPPLDPPLIMVDSGSLYVLFKQIEDQNLLQKHEVARKTHSNLVGVVFGLYIAIIRRRHATRSNHCYCVPIFQSSFSVSLSVQDNLSPLIGLQNSMPSYAACLINGSSTRVASHSPSMSTMRARAGKFWAWLYLTQLSAKLISANIFCSRWLRPIYQI
jgi:hypothetical protein